MSIFLVAKHQSQPTIYNISGISVWFSHSTCECRAKCGPAFYWQDLLIFVVAFCNMANANMSSTSEYCSTGKYNLFAGDAHVDDDGENGENWVTRCCAFLAAPHSHSPPSLLRARLPQKSINKLICAMCKQCQSLMEICVRSSSASPDECHVKLV